MQGKDNAIKSQRPFTGKDEQSKGRSTAGTNTRRVRKTINVTVEDMEVQTDPFLDDYMQRISNSLNYIIQIVDSAIEFKTEVQNISIATRMMSESKINHIRSIFKHIVTKA